MEIEVMPLQPLHPPRRPPMSEYSDPIELLTVTAHMLRGMTMDWGIPGHARQACYAQALEIEAFIAQAEGEDE